MLRLLLDGGLLHGNSSRIRWRVCKLLYSGFVSVAGGCLTVTGRTLAENLKDVQPPGVEQVCAGVFVSTNQLGKLCLLDHNLQLTRAHTHTPQDVIFPLDKPIAAPGNHILVLVTCNPAKGTEVAHRLTPRPFPRTSLATWRQKAVCSRSLAST